MARICLNKRTGVFGYLILAMGILILPLRWIIALVLAAAFHELCHLGAVYLCGGKILDFRLNADGAVIMAEPMSRGRVLFCTLAGPLGALLLVPFARWLPATAVCALFQSMYNLLPIFPLDGGRAVRTVAQMLLPEETADKLCSVLQWICVGTVCGVAVYGAFALKLGVMPLLFALALLGKMNFRKIPCNQCGLGVQ